MTISAGVNQLKLKIKSHLILPDQPPQQEFLSVRVKGFERPRKGREEPAKEWRESERKRARKQKISVDRQQRAMKQRAKERGGYVSLAVRAG